MGVRSFSFLVCAFISSAIFSLFLWFGCTNLTSPWLHALLSHGIACAACICFDQFIKCTDVIWINQRIEKYEYRYSSRLFLSCFRKKKKIKQNSSSVAQRDCIHICVSTTNSFCQQSRTYPCAKKRLTESRFSQFRSGAGQTSLNDTVRLTSANLETYFSWIFANIRKFRIFFQIQKSKFSRF